MSFFKDLFGILKTQQDIEREQKEELVKRYIAACHAAIKQETTKLSRFGIEPPAQQKDFSFYENAQDELSYPSYDLTNHFHCILPFSDDVCKIGILTAISRAKTKINSFAYCIPVIEDIAEEANAIV